jgi:L-asparaginase
MARVAIVATGGTIANTLSGRISVEDVLHDVPEAPDIADIQIVDVLRAGSWEFSTDDWLTIARAVSSAAEDERVDGVVVTHGTLIAEETAYFLNLVVKTQKPIVLACSQRKHRTLSNDGDRNLVDALRIARAPQARGLGVLLTLAEEIHAARDVVKTNQRPGGFVSRNGGLLGHVEADQVSFYRAPLRRHTAASEFDIRSLQQLPSVDIVATYAGAGAVPIQALAEAGSQGLVVEGFAFSGKPTAAQETALLKLAERGLPIVCANRGEGGRVPVSPDSPFVQGDNLSASKARILLMLALTQTTDRHQIQRIFDEY